MKPTKKQLIDEFLGYRVDKIVDRKSLARRLASGKKLIVKHGVDPTTSDLHLGYAVVYHKLRALQDMGHKVVFLIGSFTARFGDPTDRQETRQLRSHVEVKKMAKNYITQALKILDPNKTEIRYNAEWYDKMSAEELLSLISHFTHAQMMERDMFRERQQKKQEIGLHEPIYPVLQGYDSVMLGSDLTVIGTDQLFNEMRGRDLQRDFGQAPQDIVAVPLLLGIDGKNKMSQSLGNEILITESANDQFGKVMSLPDSAMMHYWQLATNLPPAEIAAIGQELQKKGTNPMDIKLRLAQAIVTIYHGEVAAERAAQNFTQVFRQRELPQRLPTISFPPKSIGVIDFLVESGLVDSKSEAKRMIMQRAVRVNQELIHDPHYQLRTVKGMVIQIGRRRFIRIK